MIINPVSFTVRRKHIKAIYLKKSNSGHNIIRVEDPQDLTFRPIVAGPQCPTHRLSQLLDLILQLFIKFVPSHTIDTVDLLSKLPETASKDEILITIDIKSLYSIISHDVGISAVEYWILKHPEVARFPVTFIEQGCLLILKNNPFQFNGKNYLQIHGTAMGTKMAPI